MNPKPRYFEDAVYELATEIAELVIVKQRDYGHDNINAFGLMGIVVRSSDKVARLRNLIKERETTHREPLNESVQDTLMDTAGYSILGLMLERDWFKLELAEEVWRQAVVGEGKQDFVTEYFNDKNA